MSSLFTALILLFVYALPLSAWATQVPLTLVQAQQIALDRSRQLTAQDLSVRSSQAMAMAAGHLPDPIVKVGIDNLPVNGSERFNLSSDFMTMRRIGIMQEITRSDKREARAAQYHFAAQKSQIEKELTIAIIQRDTALAWLDRYFTEQMASVVAEQIAQSQQEIQAAESRYRAARGNQSDIFAARTALALVEDRASEIGQRMRNASVALARWIGDAANTTLAHPPVMETIPIDSATLNEDIIHHPQIAVLNQQINIAQADAKLAQANKQADWSVEVTYQQRGSAFSDMVSVGISVPWQWDQKNRQDRELYARLVEVDKTTAERDEQLRQHIADTRNLISEWRNNQQRSIKFESTLIPLANSRIAAVVAAYRGGKASLSDVLAARREQIDIRLQALQLQLDTARLWAQITFLIPATMTTTSKELQ